MSDYLTNLFNLHDKVAVITGAGGYLCSEMGRACAAAGIKVVVTDSRNHKAEAVADEIEKQGGIAIAMCLDVIDKNSFLRVRNETIDAFGRIDCLINGAGINAPTPILNIPMEEWDRILTVNLRGTLLGCQVFGETMLQAGKGSIINISSASAGPPLSKAFTYSVSKAGVWNLTQNLAREWADRGVRVNALRPGFFPTEWSQKNFIDACREKAILGHTPMARYGEPRELVGAVLWLLSDAASFVTGAEIAVDGGFSAMTI